MKKVIIRFILFGLVLALGLPAAALGDTDYDNTYETALRLAGNDLTNKSNVQDAIMMIGQIGSYKLSKIYLIYFQQIINIQSEQPDLEEAKMLLDLCNGAEAFTDDLALRSLPSCSNLLNYVSAREQEMAGDLHAAYALYRKIVILDAPDRALALAILLGNSTPPPTDPPTAKPTPKTTPKPTAKITAKPTPILTPKPTAVPKAFITLQWNRNEKKWHAFLNGNQMPDSVDSIYEKLKAESLVTDTQNLGGARSAKFTQLVTVNGVVCDGLFYDKSEKWGESIVFQVKESSERMYNEIANTNAVLMKEYGKPDIITASAWDWKESEKAKEKAKIIQDPSNPKDWEKLGSLFPNSTYDNVTIYYGDYRKKDKSNYLYMSVNMDCRDFYISYSLGE